MELRPYQREVVDRVQQGVAAGKRRACIVAPTGSGKTVMAAELVRRFEAEGVLVLAHRREIVFQTAQKFWAHGIDPAIIMAEQPLRAGHPIQVASVQTLHARAIRGSAIDLPRAGLIVVDEAHHIRAESWREIIEKYPEAVLVGLTATPCRSDGRGLGSVFQALVECPQIPDLIAERYLVGTVVYAPSIPDLDGIKTRQGDYVQEQVEGRMDNAHLVGDIVEHWLRLAGHRRTVVFASGVGHSVHLRDAFRAEGVLAEHIDGTTDKDERDGILARLAKGEVTVVTNFGVLTEGWDQPEISCCVLARPTKQMGLYRQMAGRVLRPAPGKDHALILDHAGLTFSHGYLQDEVMWTLEEDERAANHQHRRRQTHYATRLAACPACKAIRRGGEACSACGWAPAPRPNAIVADGHLERIERDGRTEAAWTEALKRHFYAELRGIARQRDYRDGWAAHKFKERFGRFPPWAWNDDGVLDPEPATASWVKSRQIAYAKAKAKTKEASIAA